MITVPILLDSAITHNRTSLGLLVIDNIGGSETRGDYRVRMYGEGSDYKSLGHVMRTRQPIREGRVTGYARLDEPVGNLVAKALGALGYE